MQGKIIGIYTYPQVGANAITNSMIELVAGAGIVGDRYYNHDGTFSKEQAIKPKQEITFIESEQINRFNLENSCALNHADLRRNIITEGVPLNDLVGKEFQFGLQRFKGIELCEPCAYLAKTVEAKLLPAMIGNGGLRAQILNDGELNINDEFILT